MQQMLCDEVTESLGRAKHQRRWVDMQGYRNGYVEPRRLTMRSGTITVRRPRVRDVNERFASRLLPLFTRRTKEARDLRPDLCLHGLASGDFELALSGLLGDQAALSARSAAVPRAAPRSAPRACATRRQPRDRRRLAGDAALWYVTYTS